MGSENDYLLFSKTDGDDEEEEAEKLSILLISLVCFFSLWNSIFCLHIVRTISSIVRHRCEEEGYSSTSLFFPHWLVGIIVPIIFGFSGGTTTLAVILCCLSFMVPYALGIFIECLAPGYFAPGRNQHEYGNEGMALGNSRSRRGGSGLIQDRSVRRGGVVVGGVEEVGENGSSSDDEDDWNNETVEEIIGYRVVRARPAADVRRKCLEKHLLTKKIDSLPGEDAEENVEIDIKKEQKNLPLSKSPNDMEEQQSGCVEKREKNHKDQCQSSSSGEIKSSSTLPASAPTSPLEGSATTILTAATTHLSDDEEDDDDNQVGGEEGIDERRSTTNKNDDQLHEGDDALECDDAFECEEGREQESNHEDEKRCHRVDKPAVDDHERDNQQDETTEERENNNGVQSSQSGDDGNDHIIDINSNKEENEEQSNTQPCSICLERFQMDDEVGYSPNEQCTHEFHKACILEWLMTSSECPVCRRDFLATSLPAGESQALASRND